MAHRRFASRVFAISIGIGMRTCLGMAVLCPTTALRAQTPTGDDAAIRAILQRQQDAWNAGDAKAFAADAAEDALFTNIVGTPFIGRKSFEERHAMIFRTIYQGSHLTIRTRTLQSLTSDIALVEAELALSGFKSLPPGVKASADGVLYTECEEVFAKRNGAWQMVAFHNVDRKPPAVIATEAAVHCDIGSYVGDYGFTATGTLSGRKPVAIVGRFTADGHGNINGSQARSSNGTIVHETYVETYQLNADCTGSSHKETSAGAKADFSFVLLSHGTTAMYVQTDPSDVVTLQAERSN